MPAFAYLRPITQTTLLVVFKLFLFGSSLLYNCSLFESVAFRRPFPEKRKFNSQWVFCFGFLLTNIGLLWLTSDPSLKRVSSASMRASSSGITKMASKSTTVRSWEICIHMIQNILTHHKNYDHKNDYNNYVYTYVYRYARAQQTRKKKSSSSITVRSGQMSTWYVYIYIHLCIGIYIRTFMHMFLNTYIYRKKHIYI